MEFIVTKKQSIRSIDCNIDFECMPASLLLYRFDYIYYLLLLFVHATKGVFRLPVNESCVQANDREPINFQAKQKLITSLLCAIYTQIDIHICYNIYSLAF